MNEWNVINFTSLKKGAPEFGIVYNFSSRGEIEHNAAYAKFWRDNKEYQEYYGIFLITSKDLYTQ